ncbi:MAG: OsmC family protein [Paracoccaceae bacterium]
MKRTASAVWRGDLPSGEGAMSAPSKVLDTTPYSFKTRFEEGVTGTNPEELIAAAHAGCFSMALSHELAEAGHKPSSVETTASVEIVPVEGGFSITGIHLDTDATVPGIDKGEFDRIAAAAKAGCPVSKALASVEITLDARLTT